MSSTPELGSDLSKHVFGIDHAASNTDKTVGTQFDIDTIHNLIAEATAVPDYIIAGTQSQNSANRSLHNNREEHMNSDYFNTGTTASTTASLYDNQYIIRDTNQWSSERTGDVRYIIPERQKTVIDKLKSIDENEALALLDMLSAQNFHRHDCPAVEDDMVDCTCDWKPYKDLITDFIDVVLEERT